MATYRIIYWKEFPAQVNAEDETGTVKLKLSARFHEAIDAAAMAEGSADSEAYLVGWEWGADQERPGSAHEVAEAVIGELEQEYPKSRLAEMIRGRR